MSKKKRMGRGLITTLILALAMTMGLGITTFAQPSYKPVSGDADKVPYEKKLDLHGATEAPTHTVTITATYHSKSPSSADAPTGTPAVVTLEFGPGKDTTQTGFIDFSTVQFTSPGKYTYVIRESHTGNSAIKRVPGSMNEYWVDVYVENVKTTTGQSDLKIQDYQLYKTNNAGKADKATFENEWDNYRFTVGKQVTGNQGNKKTPFNIAVRFTGTAGQVYSITQVSGTPSVNNIELNAGETTSVTLDSSSKSVSLQLKDGDRVKFEGMPKGVTYTIVEGNYTVDSYGYDAAVGEVKTAVNVEDTNDQDHTIVNNKSGTIPTGIFINNWPYLLAMSIAVAIAVVFVKKKRTRRIEDF